MVIKIIFEILVLDFLKNRVDLAMRILTKAEIF